MALTTTNHLVQVEDDRTGLTVETLKRAISDNLFYIQGKFPGVATKQDCYMALAHTIRDRLFHRWLNTRESHFKHNTRTVSYLSAEYLPGPHLGNNIVNLGVWKPVEQAVAELGLNLHELIDLEEEPGLGNGGLGRLAACFMDSLATLEIPAIGYGIRYEFGLFKQDIKEGWQVERTDKWLQPGNPWEVPRPEEGILVAMGGHTEGYTDKGGSYRVNWFPDSFVKGIPYDTPILGYRVSTANTLRLWKAEASESFSFQKYNTGDYYGAVQDKVISENITKVLYPNDEQLQGKGLRLIQQYFFVSCSLQDMIRIHLANNPTLDNFHDHFAVQLNDTHPAIGIAELMRLLVDEHCFGWDTAWHIAHSTFSFTNHTLLPEALEKWPLSLFGELLPRHLEIIYEINRLFLEQIGKTYPGDNDRLSRMSIIDESGGKSLRMAFLATIGSHAVNGVAALHTDLVKETILKEFHELWPEKFSNKTNGVTPRRWMALSNPTLADLITEKIGDGWIKNLDELRGLEQYADEADFRQQWRQAKRSAKQSLADYIGQQTGLVINPDSLFDVQVKRIHEYKRQHLSILHVIHLYLQLKNNPDLTVIPRTFIYAGKAAPGYYMAKLIIKLINAVAEMVNNDDAIDDRLKVVFLPNCNVKMGQKIYPAADLSEQISTAGKEASGTGNMKFSMNGALTIGTLDGANIEIRNEVGAENFFLFGLTEPEVAQILADGYKPWECYENNEHLKAVFDLINSGLLSQGDRELFLPLANSLLGSDPYLVFADFQSYMDCQATIGKAYRDQEHWSRMSILNVARIGKLSSDRTIREYAADIWSIAPVSIELEDLCPDGQCLLIPPDGDGGL